MVRIVILSVKIPYYTYLEVQGPFGATPYIANYSEKLGNVFDYIIRIVQNYRHLILDLVY